jgi:two-component system, NtrC family, sensor kinase
VNLTVRPSLPFFSKLLIESKILLLLLAGMLLLGAVGVASVYLTTQRTILAGQITRAETLLHDHVAELGSAVASGDQPRLESHLPHLLDVGENIVTLQVIDSLGKTLARISVAGKVTPPETVEPDISLPLWHDGSETGFLQVGLDRRPGDRVARSAALIALGMMVVSGLIFYGIARILVRRTVRPLKDLVEIADEISAGNLNPRFNFGVHVNCWEIMDCGRTDCRAYHNYTQQCWYIDGTPCDGFEPNFPQKLVRCRDCSVYQTHRGDEIVQLADSFRHLTDVLRSSQKDLVDSDDFQKRLIENSFDGIIATDGEGIVTIYNRLAKKLIGLPNEDVIGHLHWEEFFPSNLKPTLDIPLSYEPNRRLRGFAPRDSAIKAADSNLIDVRLSGISLYDRGKHIGKVFFFQDLRELNTLRESLHQSERMAVAGQAAAGISHSIKNILDGFNGGVYVYKTGKRGNDEMKMNLGWDMIERNVAIISDLVTDLLNFARKPVPEYSEFDPRVVVEAVIADTGLNLNPQLDINLDHDDSPHPVVLDYHSFHQCLANLLTNARDAIPDGEPGHITISTGQVDDRVFFSVRDDGEGMSADTIAKIRQGMYSTKGSKGTGLGLQVVQKIVAEHQGELIITSNEGRGSTFRIELPAAVSDLTMID